MKSLDKLFSLIFILFLFLFYSILGHTYLVGPSFKLEKLESESDVIFKAQVVSINPLKNSWFEEYCGFDASATEMQIISVIKGEIPEKKGVFQHYREAQGDQCGRMFSPQSYNFQIGRSYLVFAKKTDQQAIFRQLWKNHKSKEDQGVFWTADDQLIVKNISINEIVWEEFIKLLNSKDTKNVVYAIGQLDLMSRNVGWDKLDDFDRNRVMAAMHHFVFSDKDEVATAAIKALGWYSPYLDDQNAQAWLAHIGGRKAQGIGPWDRGDVNEIGQKYWNELVSVADGTGSIEKRTLAIRSLGLIKKSEIFEHLQKWINDPEPIIRQAAVILLSDYPGPATSAILKQLSKDKDSNVKYAVARVIGLGQMDESIYLLDPLIKDEDINVGVAAVESVLSLAPSKVDDLLKKYKDDPDLRPLFVNALAQVNAEPYRDELAEIINKKSESKYFRGGTIPAFLSWKILFKNIQDQDKKKIQSGALDKYLDALENTGQHSSSEPRDLYAFYIHEELTERAKAFREKCKSTFSFDMEYFFKMVDEQSNYYINNSIRHNYDTN